MAEIDYWFSVGSTYNFLIVMRLDEIARREGITFRWRPFSMWKILREMNNVPFADKPVKAAYMWRDLERRATLYGLDAKLPAPYPAQRVGLGIQLAFLGMREGWGKEFVRKSYERWFQKAEEPYSEGNLPATLEQLGLNAEQTLAAAIAEENNQLLDIETGLARELGIFGAPTFVVGKELFWGHDRLDDAIAWFRKGRL